MLVHVFKLFCSKQAYRCGKCHYNDKLFNAQNYFVFILMPANRLGSIASSSTSRDYSIRDSAELSRLIFSRMNTKSFMSFIEALKDSIAIEERAFEDKKIPHLVVSRHNVFNKISRKDKWVTSWLLRIINASHYESTPFPMLTSLPMNDEVAIHKSCLVEALLRAKTLLRKGRSP